MEAVALKFPNIERVLSEYAGIAGDVYRQYMAQYGKDASGVLSQSAMAFVRANGRGYEVVMRLADYWKYVEQGRKPGKFPPPDKIRKWIEVKPILPSPMKNGKLPTLNQLAYLIGRKIATKGIPPTPVLERTVEALNKMFMSDLTQAIRLDIGYILKSSIHSSF